MSKKVPAMSFIVLIGILLSGCATVQSTQGSKLDEKMIAQIEKGKTTRSEILKLFGAPDRIIDAGISGTAENSIKGDVNLSTQQNISLGKNQEIYIYEYIEERTETPGLLLAYGMGDVKKTSKKNTLMIWLDKDTGIVQDYGYKKEI